MPSVIGAGPFPLAKVNGGSPPRPATVTFHEAIESPAGGAIAAVTGTGFVTIEPSAGRSDVIVGGGPAAATVIVSCGLTASGAAPLVALIVNLKTPPLVGVPDKTPLVESRVNPSGSVPDPSANDGAGAPVAANVYE